MRRESFFNQPPLHVDSCFNSAHGWHALYAQIVTPAALLKHSWLLLFDGAWRDKFLKSLPSQYLYFLSIDLTQLQFGL